MNLATHAAGGLRIAEVLSETLIVRTPGDGLRLLGDLYYQGFDGIILHLHQLTPDFFDLRNGLAGELLQKFSNYRMRLGIVGDFSGYTARSIKDFMYESNRTGRVCFAASAADAVQLLAGQSKSA